MCDYILTSLIAIIVCIFCIHLLRPLALRVGFVDRPNARKHHAEDIPLIGGVVIFFGFCFSLLGLHRSLMPYRSLLAGGALLVLIGVVDDFHDLSAKLRLFGQVMVSLMLAAWGGLIVGHLGALAGTSNLVLGLWALPFTVVLVVAYINAFNMIDGQDGLAGCIGVSQAFWLLVLAHQLHLIAIMHILVILLVLLLVFLNFNLNLPWSYSAKIFLGDSGSTLLAYLLAWIGIMISQHHYTVVTPLTVLWVLAVPLFDLLSVVLYRLRQRISIFTPGRDHVHHVLTQLGVAKLKATLLLAFFQFALGGLGVYLNAYQVPEYISFFIFIGVLVSYLFVVMLLREQCIQKIVSFEGPH